MAERTGIWGGGYIHKDARGRDVYVIRQQISGKRYEVSTRASTERAALEQWKRFQSDPEGYDLRGEVRQTPIYIHKHLSSGRRAMSRRARNEEMNRASFGPAGIPKRRPHRWNPKPSP